MTRHGAGPLPTECADLGSVVPDVHNGTSEWTGAMRYGYLDEMLLRYALQVNAGADELAVTRVDQIGRFGSRVATQYSSQSGSVLRNLSELLGPQEYGVREGQMRLTARLNGWRPEYESSKLLNWRASPGSTHWWRANAEYLGVPITIVSSGPALEDTRFICSTATRPSRGQSVASAR